jgi:hypothetical protein
MNAYDPNYGKEPENTNRQLKNACELAFESVMANLGLDHWRAVMHDRSRSDSFSSSNPSPDSDSDLDSDIRAAKKLSVVVEEEKKATDINRRNSVLKSFQDSDLDIKADPGSQDNIQPSRGKRPSSTSPDFFAHISAKRSRIPYSGGFASQSDHKDKPAQLVKPRTPLEWVGRLQPREDIREYHNSSMPGTLSDCQSSSQIIGEHSSVKISNKIFPRQTLLDEECFKHSTKPSGNKSRSSLKSENSQYNDAELYVSPSVGRR